MTFGGFVIYIFNLGVALGAVLAFIVIAFNGIKLLNFPGDPPSLSEAKKKIINALLGLTVLLVSYLLLTTINPDLVDVKNISLGVTQFSFPVLSPEEETINKPELSFTEIPIGTIAEGILVGNSSTRNKLECYEYDDETGEVVDKNSDGHITEKDIILDRDIFYCMKDLETALRKKTEIKVSKLIKELDTLMESCSCSRVFVDYEPPAYLYTSAGKCGCTACGSYCKTCGHSHTGCPGAPGNNLEGDASLEQYTYDPCPNRKQIDCKRQEIKQLLDGSEPEKICYDQGWIDKDATKYPDILTFSDGIKRMTEFRDYFINEVNVLKEAEKGTKSPFGERLTLAEFYTLQNNSEDNLISKSQFGDYNIFRYCTDYCVETQEVDGKIECIKYELNDQLRACKDGDSGENFLYDGDPATFYFNSTYYEQESENSKDNSKDNYKCSVYEKDNNGVIPIGETVDGTEKYGLEVAERISNLIENIQGVYNTALAISNLPENCDSSNCVNSNSNCCSQPACSCDGECCCPSVSFVSCYGAVPGASKYSNYKNYTLGYPMTKPYTGCSTFCGGKATTRLEESQYFACSYGTFCDLVKKIYQTRGIESSCYDQTDNEAEKVIRETNIGKVGYLQKWMERENRLYELTEMESLKKVDGLDSGIAQDVISDVCRSYFIDPEPETLECDGDLSTAINKIDGRFNLVEKLETSREKINSCITGYSFPYKENLSTAFVFNCLEGISHQTIDNLIILPEFPYPSTKNSGYQNCYPYNSSDLTAEQKNKCFQNIYRVGDESDPGCQTIVEDYMDNYYCCK
ncbi:MAG: pilin [Minisyncoccales bacterium]